MDSPASTRIVLGLGLILALAVLAAHPRVRALERRFGVGVLVAAGLPFLLLGALFATSTVDILTPHILVDLRPAFEFALGWMGFVVGVRLDVRELDRLPRSLGILLVCQTLVPAALTMATAGPLLHAFGIGPGNGLVRDLLLLAGCAAASAPIAATALGGDRQNGELLRVVASLDAFVALLALAAVSIYLRPDASVTNWSLPGSAWLLLMAGLGALMGVVTFFLLRAAKNETERAALLIGAIALSAGAAGYLDLSSPVVCALAGAVLANLPHPEDAGFARILKDVERPLYLVLLVIVGATWQAWDYRGWALAGAFVLGRIPGKYVAARIAARTDATLPPARLLAPMLMPQGPVAVVVMAAAGALHGADAPAPIGWAIHAAIVGTIASEIVARLLRRAAIQRVA